MSRAGGVVAGLVRAGALVAALAGAGGARAQATGLAIPQIGDVMGTYPLPGLTSVAGLAGLAYLESRDELFALDSNEDIHVYTWTGTGLVAARTFRVPNGPAQEVYADGMGLALTVEGGVVVLYALSSRPVSGAGYDSAIFRVTLGTDGLAAPQTTDVIDLDRAMFELHGNRATGIAANGTGELIVAHERHRLPTYGSATSDETEHTRRGLRRFSVTGTCGTLTCLQAAVAGTGWLARRSLPDAGWGKSHALGITRGRTTTATWSLTYFAFGDASADNPGRYLVGTIRTGGLDDEVYVASQKTGRGLFTFPSPYSSRAIPLKLAYGGGALFVGQSTDVKRVMLPDVGTSPALLRPLERGRRPRTIEMTQWVDPENGGLSNGWERHFFGRPHSHADRPSQGFMTGTASVAAGGAPWSSSTRFASPGGAPGQAYERVELTGVNSQRTSVTYSAGFWHRYRRHYVFPHLTVDDHATAFPAGSDFAAGRVDDAQMFRFADKEQTVYEPFLDAARRHLAWKYGLDEDEIDLRTPYWAARNVQEYIRDTYNYPMDAAYGAYAGYVGSVEDEADLHFASSPAYHKLALAVDNPGSGDTGFCDGGARRGAYNRVLMCASASQAFVGAMRYLGIPARWVGTSQRSASDDGCPDGSWRPEIDDDWMTTFCDLNGNRVFDGDDWMTGTHGHMTAEVWMGARYGWQRFEPTPATPGDTNEDGIAAVASLDEDATDADVADAVAAGCLDWARIHAAEPQYIFMSDYSAAGPQEKAVSTTMGVGYLGPFFKDFEDNAGIDCRGDGGCQGDVVYTFGLAASDPTRRDRGHRSIRWRPALGFTVLLDNPDGRQVTVTATPTGDWSAALPHEKVEIVAVETTTGTEVTLASDLPFDFGSRVVSNTRFGIWRVLVRRQGFDRIVGGAAARFMRWLPLPL
jgi:hypothetical protein